MSDSIFGSSGKLSQNRNRPCRLRLYRDTETFPWRNRPNRTPEPLEPSHAQTVTEPVRTVATLRVATFKGKKTVLLATMRAHLRHLHRAPPRLVNLPEEIRLCRHLLHDVLPTGLGRFT